MSFFFGFNYGVECLIFLYISECMEIGGLKLYKCLFIFYDFWLVVNEFGFFVREVFLVGVVEDLEEGVFFWGCVGYLLVKSIFK